MDVLLATSADQPDLGGDGPAILAALARRRLDAGVAVWDDPAVDWGAARLVLVRSTWDYTERRTEFLGWARAVATTGADLRNPLDVLVHNSHKAYLRDLARAGVPVVPTLWPEPGEPLDLGRLPGDGDVVVKPAVSAGARGASRVARGDAAGRVAALHRSGGTPMVQPYLGSVETVGETKTLVFGGAVSHAVVVPPMLVPGADPDAHEAEPRLLADDERALVEQVLAAVPERDLLVYARIDTVRGDDGRPLLAELELVEPHLFLDVDPAAADRFAAAVADLL